MDHAKQLKYFQKSVKKYLQLLVRKKFGSTRRKPSSFSFLQGRKANRWKNPNRGSTLRTGFDEKRTENLFSMARRSGRTSAVKSREKFHEKKSKFFFCSNVAWFYSQWQKENSSSSSEPWKNLPKEEKDRFVKLHNQVKRNIFDDRSFLSGFFDSRRATNSRQNWKISWKIFRRDFRPIFCVWLNRRRATIKKKSPLTKWTRN